MAVTNVNDIIVPEVFWPYFTKRLNDLNAFVRSGIITADQKFNQFVDAEGITVNMPYWEDLTGDEETVGRNSETQPGNIGTDKDVAIKFMREKSFGARDIAGMLATGTMNEPMMVIADGFAEYWVRQDQKRLLNTLSGVMDAPTMAPLTRNIALGAPGTSGVDNWFTATSFIDAKQLLGDHKDQLTALAMHSAVEAWLTKQDLIDFVPASESRPSIKTFMGHEIHIDDGMTRVEENGTYRYDTFLFGRGAVASGEGTKDEKPLAASGTWKLEYGRDSKKGVSWIIQRRKLLQHIRGVRWKGNPAEDMPNNSELATSTNWERVFDVKDMKVVRFRHNIKEAA